MAARRSLLLCLQAPKSSPQQAVRAFSTKAILRATPSTTAFHSDALSPLWKLSSRPKSVRLRQRYSTEKSSPSVHPESTLYNFEDVKALAEKKDENVVLVDVREPHELVETGIIPGAVNIPITTAVQSFHISPEEFEEANGFARPGVDKTLVFYCKAGVRAKSAAGLAKHAGWNSVGEYPGSWLDWEKHGGPVEPWKGKGSAQ